MADQRRPRHFVDQPDPVETQAADAALETAARAFVPDVTRLSPVGNGRRVRADAPSGAWLIRRWRAGSTEGRIRFVHDLLRAVRADGIEIVPDVLLTPDGSEVLTLDGILYDAQRWLPGAPLGRAAPERGPVGEFVNLPSTLAEADRFHLIETLARIHTASEPLARAHGAPTVSIAAVASAVLGTWERARVRLRTAAPSTPAIQRWILAGERALRPAIRDLAAAEPIYRDASVVCHGDLWPAHTLWTRSAEGSGAHLLTGIVDWADAAAGSPLLDLAQLVSHFGGWTAHAAEDAIGAYSAVRRLGPEERRLLPAVAILDLIAEAGWLLTVADAGTARRESLSTPLRQAIDDVVTSLEHAAAVAIRGDRPTKPVRRAWVHRPRPAGAQRDGERASARPPGTPDRTSGRSPSRPQRGADRARTPRSSRPTPDRD